MSTRSGKRIHSSFNENISKPDAEAVIQNERKTRSKRPKEHIEELCVSVLKGKKRNNYVSYPTDDEMATDAAVTKSKECKPTRALRKNALKELNLPSSESDNAEPVIQVPKSVRQTRRTRRPDEDVENLQENHHDKQVVSDKTKNSKKLKKKKSIDQEVETRVELKLKRNKKKLKKSKQSGSMLVEDIEPLNSKSESLNKSNKSIDSFHSAAGSPDKNTLDNSLTEIFQKSIQLSNSSKNNDNTIISKARQTRSSSRHSNTTAINNNINDAAKKSRKRKSRAHIDIQEPNDKSDIDELESTLTNKTKKRKSSDKSLLTTDTNDDKKPKDSTFDLEDLEKRKAAIKAVLVNTTLDTLDPPTPNTIFEKEPSFTTSTAKKQSATAKLNSTYEKDKNNSGILLKTEAAKGDPVMNTTFDKSRKSEIINTTFEKDLDNDSGGVTKKSSMINVTYEKDNISSVSINTNDDKDEKSRSTKKLNSTFDNNGKSNSTFDKSTKDTTFDKTTKDTTFDKTTKDTTFDKITKDTTFDKSTKDTTFDKITKDSTFDKSTKDTTFDKTTKDTTFDKSTKDTTFDKTTKDTTFDKSTKDTTFDKSTKDTTFNKDKKLDTTFDKESKSSLISSDSSKRDSNITLDKSDISRISITSDESKENIVNTTPVLIESSLEESKVAIHDSPKSPYGKHLSTPQKGSSKKIRPHTVTPLKREGTFTKEESDLDKSVQIPKTPERKMSLPSPGCTPFPTRSGAKVLNVTRSLEKSRRSSFVEPLPRATRVMFCSPVNNPAVVMQQRGKVIKSSLKGSNKSFVFDDNELAPRPAPRKRSYTHSDVEEARAKRSRLEGAPPPATRALRARTASAGHAGKPEPGPSKQSPGPPRRTKLPNFAALHHRHFAKMESLDECQRRKARRAQHLLTPTGGVAVLDRTSPKEPTVPTDTVKKISPNLPEEPKQKTKSKKQKLLTKRDPSTSRTEEPQSSNKEPKKPDTPVKSLPTLKSLNPGYTRFGFKLNVDVNPFNIPTNPNASLMFSNKKNTDNTKPLKEIKALKRQTSALGGSRKEAAKQTVMREKSFTDKRSVIRDENRTLIKGVRTNRRFELQMRMRNMD